MKHLILLLMFITTMFPIPLTADEASDFDNVFQKIAGKLSQAEKKLPNDTVAVYGFEVIGRPGDSYAEYATEKLTHEIVTIGAFSVIERSRIDEIMKEQNLSLSGAIDAGTASKIGKILAVDAMIIGTIHVTDKETEFIARIISSDKGLILGSADERIKAETGEVSKIAQPATPATSTSPVISADKATYTAADSITVTYSGLPGNLNDWLTLVSAALPDTTYGDWSYTQGKKSGTYTFKKVVPGDYEIRLYFDWPEGGYVVQGRVKISVK